MVTKEQVRDTLEYVEELDLAEGASWMLVHEMIGLEYGEVFPIIAADPAFFGVEIEGGGDARD